MDGIPYRVEQVEKEVSYHRKMLLEGNGKPGLTTRMQQVEDCMEVQEQRITDQGKRIDKIDTKFWAIILLLLTLLGGVVTDIVEKAQTQGRASLITSDHFTVSER